MTNEDITQNKLQTLNRIAFALEEQNKLIEKSIEISQRIFAIQILNSKINAKIAVILNAFSVIDYKEFIELVDQV